MELLLIDQPTQAPGQTVECVVAELLRQNAEMAKALPRLEKQLLQTQQSLAFLIDRLAHPVKAQ